jgi:hypothetical protein
MSVETKELIAPARLRKRMRGTMLRIARHGAAAGNGVEIEDLRDLCWMLYQAATPLGIKRALDALNAKLKEARIR